MNNHHNWQHKVSSPAQVGGIETSVLDNGPGRGTRVAWFNTGSGLRFKVVLDRAMDITDTFMNASSLVWLSHQGTVPPRSNANRGIEWLRSFGGGLMTTCGLDHVGGPEEDEHGSRGLHGEISNTPAELLSLTQPDLLDGQDTMSITGRVLQSTVFGPHLELTRTISARLGHSKIDVHDKIRNLGNMATPHMILYHLNFGWPLVDEGTQIRWEGDWEARDSSMDRHIFNKNHNFRICPDVLEEHQNAGEAAAFIDPHSDENGEYRFGLHNPATGLEVVVTANKNQLPALTNWQHFGKREYVVGLEPGTNHPIGQTAARKAGQLKMLQPGKSVEYHLHFEVNQTKT